MSYRVRIDTFTSLDGLTPKECRDPELVLGALRIVTRISVWDMDNRALCKTICALAEQKRIEMDNTVGFPWIGVRVLQPEPANG